MGCGESKPEVAAGNTILSHRSSEPDPGSKKSKDIETIPEANTTDNTTNSSLQQQVLEAKNEDNKDLGEAAVAADVKKIDENTAANEGGRKAGGREGDQGSRIRDDGRRKESKR
ncbi:hypothetical protein I3760_02G086500 [Carya illinoinensis]|nr:hypothetical protein I3760_02G086500 [Carya illinoinensis]